MCSNTKTGVKVFVCSPSKITGLRFILYLALWCVLMGRCCGCNAKGTCANCSCTTSGVACSTCELSKIGKCQNPIGSGIMVAKEAVVVYRCPFDGCSGGRRGAAVSVSRKVNLSRLRVHVNESHPDFVPPSSWLISTCSKLCDDCHVCVPQAGGLLPLSD